MKILGLDFETQDDQAKTTRITEVGAVLVERTAQEGAPAVYEKIAGLSAFCYEADYPPQTDKIIELTGITDEMLKTDGRPRLEVIQGKLLPLIQQADIIMAHKVAFDRTVLESTCKTLGIALPDKKWFCTLSDVDWPKKYTCHKLSHLAYEYGIMVDPRTLHRAENDVDLMLNLITHCHKSFEELLAWQALPWVYLRADILGPWQDGGIQNGLAKAMGFSWENIKGLDEPKFPKWWVMRVKEDRVAKVIEAAQTCTSPFRVGRIAGIC